MTQEHYKIDIDNMYFLMVAVYTDYKFREKDFPYDNLLSQVDTYKMTNTPFDPDIHKIDDFMVDAYKIYDKYLSIEDKLGELLESFGFGKFLGLSEDKLKEEFHKITGTFEDIITHCDFDGVQIRGIQKNFLMEKMSVAANEENYELAAILRDKINKI